MTHEMHENVIGTYYNYILLNRKEEYYPARNLRLSKTRKDVFLFFRLNFLNSTSFENLVSFVNPFFLKSHKSPCH